MLHCHLQLFLEGSHLASRNSETCFKLPERNFKRERCELKRKECKCNQSFLKFAFCIAHHEAFHIHVHSTPPSTTSSLSWNNFPRCMKIHFAIIIIYVCVCAWGFLHFTYTHTHTSQPNSFLIHQLIPCIINDVALPLSHAVNDLHIHFGEGGGGKIPGKTFSFSSCRKNVNVRN